MADAGLSRRLREIFIPEFPPNDVHCLLADEAATKDVGVRRPFPVVMTTNYDDTLERAFAARGQQFDVLTYSPRRNRRGQFVHITVDHERIPIKKPKKYDGLDPERRCVVLKLHGSIDRADETHDQYVITDTQYATYLRDVMTRLPPAVGEMVRGCSMLFLGYGLSDWNLRVFLLDIWRDQPRTTQSWAVEREPKQYDEAFWKHFRVELVRAELADWVRQMKATAT